MSEHVESVKAIAAYLQATADKNRNGGSRFMTEKLESYANKLVDAANLILHLEGLTSALPPDLGNIHDLPKELLDELTVAKTDEIEDQIVTVINAYGDEVSLDQILVGLYRKFKVMQKRRFVQNKLYKMTMVWNVPGRKGVYTTSEPDLDGREANRPGVAADDNWEDPFEGLGDNPALDDIKALMEDADPDIPF